MPFWAALDSVQIVKNQGPELLVMPAEIVLSTCGPGFFAGPKVSPSLTWDSNHGSICIWDGGNAAVERSLQTHTAALLAAFRGCCRFLVIFLGISQTKLLSQGSCPG